jgi:site-specific recombinase XerD
VIIASSGVLLLALGADQGVVMEILAHSQISMTSRYAMSSRRS